MDRLGIRELRNQTAAAVRRAAAGERIVITVDGRPAAMLGPIEPDPAQPTLEAMAARGLLTLPQRADRPPDGLGVALWPGARIDRVLREVRG